MSDESAIYEEVIRKLEEYKKVWMVTRFCKKKGALGADLRKELIVAEESPIEGAHLQLQKNGQEYILQEPFYPTQRMIVLGGGHIALPLVEFGARIGFRVVVVDDRLSFANPARFPLAAAVICDGFLHALETLHIRESDYVVIVTRGHRHDMDCLRAICKGNEPDYVGMIGSRRRTAIVKKELLEEGLDSLRLERVHTPIGLSIGAVTPEEIAIAIMAEIIQWKRMGDRENTITGTSDIDYEVLQALTNQSEDPKALLTIIEAKGSVPRGAGARMLVYPDGRTVGSIGGGCSEAAVVGEARRMIGTNTYQVTEVDLTGDAAEEEGMVCGGKLQVLIEGFDR
jgi:xanthine dehydrogenase accessory factor